MVTSIPTKFIFSCLLIRLSASLRDKRSFSTANLLQIAITLAYSSPISSL